MPPTAASAGTVIVRRSASSPIASSRRTSIPTTRKNRNIRPSLTQWRRSMESTASPTLTVTSVVQSDV